MKNFTFKVIDRCPRLTHKVPYAIGQIKINDDFEEKFDMPLDWWSVKDYEKQWNDGFKYLENVGKSCFITKIFRPTDWQCIEWWIAHKINKKIKIRNQIIFDKEMSDELLNNKQIILDNWYDFIPPYISPFLPNGRVLSEWIVDVEE